MELKLEYQQDSPELEALLLSIDRPGSFCTSGTLVCPMPVLTVENVGILSFPVPQFQVNQLIETAQRAPYGKGADTLVDLEVRNCWEIDPEKISLSGKGWEDTREKLISAAANGLGCDPNGIHAQLYKLLIYETGSFFLPHQDTEKSPGMIATLIVSLPIFGRGGELVVRHRNSEQTLELNVEEPAELAYGAFYADCEHEVKKVTDGHRISLVYNLCVAQDNNKVVRETPDYTRHVDKITFELNQWCNNESSGDKLVWALEHEYSESGLAFNTMKNGDRAVTFALREAANQVSNCEIYLATVDIDELYDAWEDYDYRYGRSLSSHSDYHLNELIESEISISNWVAVDDSRPKFGEMDILDGELMPNGVLDRIEPYDEDYEGYTGNAGATVNLQYNLAAVVLFKRQRIINTLISRGPAQAVAWINEEIRQNNGKSSEHIFQLATDLVKRWERAPIYWRNNAAQEMLKVLHVIEEHELSREFLLNAAIYEYEGNENTEFIRVLLTLRPQEAIQVLVRLIRERFAIRPEGVLSLLVRVEKKANKWGDHKTTFFQQCTKELLTVLPESLSAKNNDNHYSAYAPKKVEVSATSVSKLFEFLCRAQVADGAQSAVQILANHAQMNLFTRSLPKALKKLKKLTIVYNSSVYNEIWGLSADCLLNRSEKRPQPPTDWRRNGDVDCNCKLCLELSEFCKNPDQQSARFSVRQDLRNHLVGQIQKSRLDLVAETEERGRPYTLIVTKSLASFERSLKVYEQDINNFGLLLNALPRDPAATNVASLAARMQSCQLNNGCDSKHRKIQE